MPLENTPAVLTMSNLFMVRYFELAIKNGINAQALLDEINLALAEFEDISERIDIKKLSDMMLIIWDTLGDEAMGLSAEPIPRSTWWMASNLAIHEMTLKEAIKVASKLYSIATNAYRVILSEEDNIATITFKNYQSTYDEHHLFAEMTLMAWHRLYSWLIAESIPLKTITLPYPVVPHVEEYYKMFPANFEFNADQLSLSFASKYLSQEIVQNKTSLRIFISNCPYELFAQPKADFTLSTEIKGLIEKHLHEGCLSIEETATFFKMTKRTLIRKLTDEGTSYQTLKDIVRRDKSVHFLMRRSLTVSEIAHRVGFSDSAVFTRAFKKWMGVTPLAYRSTHAQSQQ